MRTPALLGLALAFPLAACAPADPGPGAEEDDLVAPDGKYDTGYYSSLATELEGEFTSTLELDVSALDEAARQALLEEYRGGGYALSRVVDDQLKLAKNQLNASKLHLNLSSSDVSVADIALDGAVLRVRYAVKADSIVSYEELRADGIEPSDFLDRRFDVKVAADPRQLFTRVGEACASGFDAGALADYNYFYYFDPAKEGCSLALAAESFLYVRSLLPQQETYPEYDRLTADGKIEAVVFFGAAEHNETVDPYDWGMMEWRDFNRALSSRDFRQVEGMEHGQRWQRTRAGLVETIDVVSPTDLHDLNQDTDGLFIQALKSHEIVIYDGHSFYGSLNVLRDRANYPEGLYQIIFMNSCWSYEYYTKQVFQNKATDADPTGWDLADVVNDTESGWFHNMEDMTRIVVTNVLAGAETGGIDGTRHYSWQRIVGAMNDRALESWETHNSKSHEIYGVSGVRTNRYTPAQP